MTLLSNDEPERFLALNFVRVLESSFLVDTIVVGSSSITVGSSSSLKTLRSSTQPDSSESSISGLLNLSKKNLHQLQIDRLRLKRFEFHL